MQLENKAGSVEIDHDPLLSAGCTRTWFLFIAPLTLSAVLLAVLLCSAAALAQPQFPQGGPRQGQAVSTNPEEMAAFSAAVNEPDSAVRASAIQQFLVNYPNSSLRQSAIAQLFRAQRQSRGASPTPSPESGSPVRTQPMVSTPAPQPVQISTGPAKESLLLQPAKPAQVTIIAHTLAIKADNSGLAEILHQISGSTGMKIEGLTKDERVFGSYGPGEARDVLMALLDGSGYNIVMVGDSAGGAPRELTLSPRTTTASASAAPVRSSNGEDDEDADQDVPQTPPIEPAQPLPGSPQNSGPANDGSNPQQPRSPQEILQELQRIRQQQQPNGNAPQ
ncbi:Cell division protein FtsK [Acidisarcina polymorpha]|uniref:Cell division protein FtsK n=1 Tax=Acidisarcina polymorpha TaxID=2211140 RepID=A0A2Z5G4H0_9BACT|nr:hypothetical protein [Acidisarcina polymorpha]AXC13416.1 Cell division protein FtsK [Acidisarcina polymorpha]